jgi:hypothetical protein
MLLVSVEHSMEIHNIGVPVQTEMNMTRKNLQVGSHKGDQKRRYWRDHPFRQRFVTEAELAAVISDIV